MRVRTENLSKAYPSGTTTIGAVDDVSLEIDLGEFVAITGPSGSGKTTFLNLVGLLDEPTSGRLFFDEIEVGSLALERRAELRNELVGFIFQDYSLLARHTAVENVELPLLYRRTSSTRRRRLATDALAEVGLSSRVDHLPTQLSGGEQQRVAIARALVTDPSLILADEPTGALDSRTGEQILSLLSRINTSGCTVILVTHDPEIAGHADRTVRFIDGRAHHEPGCRTPARWPPSRLFDPDTSR